MHSIRSHIDKRLVITLSFAKANTVHPPESSPPSNPILPSSHIVQYYSFPMMNRNNTTINTSNNSSDDSAAIPHVVSRESPGEERRSSKRVKLTPKQAREKEGRLILNRGSTDQLFAALKKRGVLKQLQHYRLDYPKDLQLTRRCHLRSMYALMTEEDQESPATLKFIHQRSIQQLVPFDNMARVQTAMNQCTVALEGEIIYVGCHWFALNSSEKMLVDDSVSFNLLVDYSEAKKAIHEVLQELGCDWAFLKKEN